jgi:hypothetical protein
MENINIVVEVIADNIQYGHIDLIIKIITDINHNENRRPRKDSSIGTLRNISFLESKYANIINMITK